MLFGLRGLGSKKCVQIYGARNFSDAALEVSGCAVSIPTSNLTAFTLAPPSMAPRPRTYAENGNFTRKPLTVGSPNNISPSRPAGFAGSSSEEYQKFRSNSRPEGRLVSARRGNNVLFELRDRSNK